MGKKLPPSKAPSSQLQSPSYPKDTEFLQTLERTDQKEGIQSLIRLQNSLLGGISPSSKVSNHFSLIIADLFDLPILVILPKFVKFHGIIFPESRNQPAG